MLIFVFLSTFVFHSSGRWCSTADVVGSSSLLDLIRSGEEKLDLGNDRDVVTLLGNSGSGKSALALYLAGYDSELISVQTDPFLPIFSVVDNTDLIGNETLVSRTLVPNRTVYKKSNETAWFDMPGFMDTRSTDHDIAANYFIKRVLNFAKRIKLVFVVNYNSVKKNGDRHDFLALMKHISELVNDVSKFKNSIALIATKVENILDTTSGARNYLSDETMIKSIVLSLEENKRKFEAERNEKAVQLINIFCTQEKDQYPRIGIFRQPNVPGPLSNVTILQQGKPALEAVIKKNTIFTPMSNADFNSTLSAEAKEALLILEEDVFRNTTEAVASIARKMIFHFDKRHESMYDLDELAEKAAEWWVDKKSLNTVSKFARFVSAYVEKLDINMDADEESTKILGHESFLKSICEISGEGEIDWSPYISEGMKEFIEHLEDSRNWYNFLVYLYKTTSSYKVLSSRSVYNSSDLEKEIEHLDQTFDERTKIILSQLKTIEPFLNTIEGALEVLKNIERIRVTKAQLSLLKSVLDTTLNCANIVLSCEQDKFVARGRFVLLSEILIPLLECENSTFIQILALEKFFVDISVDRSSNKWDQFFVIAPAWEIVGQVEISLNGSKGIDHRPDKAPDGIKSIKEEDRNGLPGIPGVVGDPAGHFLGIGANFVGTERQLTIFASGGEGGRGQDGGDGFQGDEGTEAVEKPMQSKSPIDLHQTWPHNKVELLSTDTRYKSIKSTKFMVHASPPSDGGNGGDGAVGGKGGYPGRFILIDVKLQRVHLDFTGENGMPGSAGIGGEPGGPGPQEARNLVGMYEEVQIDHKRIYRLTNFEYVKNEDKNTATEGKRGVAGIIDWKIEPYKPVVEGLYAAVNNYKVFVRENLNRNLRKSVLEDFLARIDNETTVKSLYDFDGFWDEFSDLLKQHDKYRHVVNFLPFYQSLKNRVLDYVQVNKVTEEQKKLLAYLYTMSMIPSGEMNSTSEISGFWNVLRNRLVINVPEYLAQISNEFEEFKNLSNVAIANKLKQEYQEEIKEKVKEGRDLIQTVLVPEMNVIFEKIDNTVANLLQEIADARNETSEERQHKLKRWIPLRAFFGILQVTSAYLSFLVSEGGLVSKVLGGVSMVAGGLAFDSGNPAGDIYQLENLLSATRKSISVVKQFRHKPIKLWQKQLEDVNARLKELEKSDPDYVEIENVRKQAKEVEKLIDIDLNDPKALHHERTKLRNELRDQQTILEKQVSQGVEKAQERKKYVDVMFNTILLFDIPLHLYEKYRNDDSKLKRMNEEIEQFKEPLEELEAYRIIVLQLILGTFKNLESDIEQTLQNMKEVSRFGLHVSRWRVKTSIKEIRYQLKKALQIIPDGGEDIVRHLELLQDAMTTLIDMYDRIEAYRESAEFAAYVADINSERATQIEVNDNVKAVLAGLDKYVKMNQILMKYSTGIDVFKQYIFPFMGSYLEEFELTSQYDGNNDVNELLEELVYVCRANIKGLLDKMKESRVIIDKYDEYVHRNVWFGTDDGILPPFATWKHQDHVEQVNILLSGGNVTLTANVKNGIKKNAVKFKTIQLYFNAVNETVQKELNNELIRFEVEMKHGGNSYYRCGEKFYSARNGVQILRYYAKENATGEPASINDVYAVIKDNDFILSPYTTWTVRLIPLDFVKSSNKFARMAKFKNETINLELRGMAQFIDTDIDVCDNSLSTYYSTTGPL